jgi:uncharacterized protein YbjT (DUF2867 family)
VSEVAPEDALYGAAYSKRQAAGEQREAVEKAQCILVIGGTRGTGFQIAGLLRKEGYPVRVLARDPSAARPRFDASVEIVEGDITKADTLPAAMREVDAIVFTAGVTGRLAGEQEVIATIRDGLRNTLAAARAVDFQGRFLYMTTVGVTQASPAAAFLDLTKRNTLKWRRQAEEELRRSGLDYTIIRAGILTNDPAGRRGIEISQRQYPLSFPLRVSRADVAEVFVRALQHPETCRRTFNVVGTSRPDRPQWERCFATLQPDP